MQAGIVCRGRSVYRKEKRLLALKQRYSLRATDF